MKKKLFVLSVCVVMMFTATGAHAFDVLSGGGTNENCIELNYQFGDLLIENGSNGSVVLIDGLSKINDPGMPDLPSKSVSILIPAGKTVRDVSVTAGGIQTYNDIIVEPAQQYISSAEQNDEKKQTEYSYSYNQSVYYEDAVYPEGNFKYGDMITMRGYSIYSMILYPVHCHGNILEYTPEMSVKLMLEDAISGSRELSYIPDVNDEKFITGNTDNLKAAKTYYTSQDNSYESSAILGSEQVDYVIITSAAMKSAFEKLAIHKAAKGLETEVVTTAEIYGQYAGRDNAERIRNFIREAYQNNRLKYVLLGGDADGTNPVLPTRILYCDPVNEGTTTQLAADMYFGCLEGDFDANENDIFGETSDNCDFTYEVYVGRAPVDNSSEAEIFVSKTIAAEKRVKQKKVTFVGEVLEGNSDGCSSDLAAEFQDSVDGKALTDNLRDLRDNNIKSKYVSLYYDSSDFVKSLFLNDLSLLKKFAAALVKYNSVVSEYLSAGNGNYIFTEEDIDYLRELCTQFKLAAENSEYSYAKKDKIISEAEYLYDYLGGCIGRTFAKTAENSRYYCSNAVPMEFGSLTYVFGGDYMDEIKNPVTVTKNGDDSFETKGFDDTHVKDTLYDRDESGYNWNKSKVIEKLNNSPEVVNHLGHCNTNWLMKCDVNEIKNLTNQQAFFLYSQGCYAGSYDNMNSSDQYNSEDSVAEVLVKEDVKSGAYACVVNSRYGWYSRTGTDGPSQAYNRYFWDRVFNTDEGDRNLGTMLAMSKHYFIDYLSGYEASTVMRFCYFTINLLGDPETAIYDNNVSVKVSAEAMKFNVGSSVTLAAKKSIQVKAFLEPQISTDSIKWVSLNKKVAKVNSAGKATAQKTGSAVIQAKTSGGVVKSFTIKVSKKRKKTGSISLDRNEVSIERGQSTELKAKVSGNKKGLKWYPSNVRVVSVNKKGLIKAKAAGTCTVICRTADGKSAKCRVTVTLPPIN